MQMTKAVRQQRSTGNTANGNTYFGMAEVDQPMRYNSKLMNSIWGRYNEHSVHNFKSLQCGAVQGPVVGGAAAYTAEAAGQTMMMQPPSPTLNGSAMRRRMRELGEAVSKNIMDNLNQY